LPTDFHRFFSFFFVFIQQILQIFADKAEKLPVQGSKFKVAADILKEKWPLGRDGLIHQGHCQRRPKTINTLSYRDLQHLQTGRLLSAETRKQKTSHCHIVAVRRRIRGSPYQLPPNRAPSISPQGGEPELLETHFIMHYKLCINIMHYAL
jgi:hypothetical protein